MTATEKGLLKIALLLGVHVIGYTIIAVAYAVL